MTDPSVVCAASDFSLSNIMFLCAANLAVGFAAGMLYARRRPLSSSPSSIPRKPCLADSSPLSSISSHLDTSSKPSFAIESPQVPDALHVANVAATELSMAKSPQSPPMSTLSTTALSAPATPQHSCDTDVFPDLSTSTTTAETLACEQQMTSPTVKARITALLIYPVQSCAALSVGAACATALGLEHDQRLIVVDFTGRPLTLAKHPALALVRPAVGTGGWLRLEAPGVRAVEFDPNSEGPIRDLCGDVGAGVRTAVDIGDAVADFFASYLEIAGLRVVRIAEDDIDRRGRAAFILATEASCAYVSQGVGCEVGVEPFRPNLVVDGELRAFEEEGWKRFRVGEVEFELSKPRARCDVVQMANDGTTQGEMRRVVRSPSLTRRFGNVVQVGQKVVPDCTLAVVPCGGAAVDGKLMRLGDEVVVLESCEKMNEATPGRKKSQ